MALEAIGARVTPLPAELRPLEQCIGRTLRQDVYAERDNPVSYTHLTLPTKA